MSFPTMLSERRSARAPRHPARWSQATSQREKGRGRRGRRLRRHGASRGGETGGGQKPHLPHHGRAPPYRVGQLLIWRAPVWRKTGRRCMVRTFSVGTHTHVRESGRGCLALIVETGRPVYIPGVLTKAGLIRRGQELNGLWAITIRGQSLEPRDAGPVTVGK